TLPDNLYKELQRLTEAENDSIESQVVVLLQNALQTKTQQKEAQRRENVLKVLEESRLRREQLPTDIECYLQLGAKLPLMNYCCNAFLVHICQNQDIQDLRMYRIEFFKSCYIWATQIPTIL
ncbi:MAG: hypothetical protein PT120_19375, partial [Aphanizomenon gracile PMC649.10]|nr:hypothetical protein [Aphanizomenon gracile PMC649.10]